MSFQPFTGVFDEDHDKDAIICDIIARLEYAFLIGKQTGNPVLVSIDVAEQKELKDDPTKN
jgi:hypothetical protein